MIAQQVAGKATRDAFYLSNFSAATLPPMMGVSAVVSLVGALWLSRMMTRYTPARVVPRGFGAGAVILMAIWGSSFLAPRASAIALYLYMAIFSAAMISAFWSLINETFDPHSSRRAVTVITSGGSLGGLVGGLIAWRLSSMVAVPTMLPFLSAITAVSMWGTLRVRGPEVKPATQGAAISNLESDPILPLAMLRRAPYLRNVAAVVALGAVMQGLLDYLFNSAVAKRFAHGPALLSFFAIFWVVVAALSFVREAAFGRFALKKLGLASTMALLPATVLLGGVACLALPGLPALSVLRGGEATQRNSFYRAAYEMLYTPLPEHEKRAIKIVIDVGFDRLGTMAAAGLAWTAVHFAGPRTATVLLVAVMACALVTLARLRPLHLGYISTLEESLRLAAGDVAPSIRASSDPGAPAKQGEASGDPRRRAGPPVAGEPGDARSDPGADPDIRRRIARLLSERPTQQAAEELLQWAEDARFEVRYACGRALLQITKKNATIAVPPARVIALAKTEITIDRRVWESQAAPELDDEGREGRLFEGVLRERVDRSLEHVFNLLALSLDRGSLAIAFRALHTADQRLRGTALEYLEAVLPHEIRDAIWPYLGEARPTPRVREVSEIVADLERSAAMVQM